ncbi:CCZ1 [Candida metapsilosis]|uniref:CCZ1 n=1 Tax=Candida metapsilosis TaxID=273372 RepID=A0A8H8DBK4_9ASCO|nr:CCZ1 [Candida metapsilosis]
MASYITNYLPNFRSSINAAEISENVDTFNSVDPGQIKYIAIIDASNDGLGSREESDSELNERLITFVHSDSSAEISPNVKIRLAGLMQGVYAFSSEFITTSKDGMEGKRPMVVSAGSESFVVVQIENSYNLICSIASNDEIVTKQLQCILIQQHSFFTLFHKSLTSIKEETGKDVLRDVSTRWWSEFLSGYNQKLTVREIKWPSIYNYSGFNSLVIEGYRKSSISISKRTKDEFRNLIVNEDLVAHGLIISSFSPVAKKMGLIHVEPLTGNLDPDSLVDVHKWLEFEYITQISNSGARHNGDATNNNNEDAIGFMHPMNLTNTLVVSPWNKMSDMIRGGSFSDATNANDTSPKPTGNTSRAWLSMPAVFGNSSETSDAALQISDTNDEQVSVNSADDMFGRFLYGIQPDRSIVRKLVYLPTKPIESGTSNKSSESEYQLITYFHDDIYITLVYDSSETTHLDNADFYKHLSSNFFKPFEEEVVSYQASTLGASTNSVTTLNLATIDNNFLYTVFDFKQMNYASSIPLVLDESSEKYSTIVNIHNQLIKICQNFDFSAHEFYHKFTLGNKHDWMSYIIKHGSKLIVIIKNNTKNSSGNSVLGAGSISADERTMVNQITGLVSDYASLGFLENLGDDVKYWLGQVIDTE